MTLDAIAAAASLFLVLGAQVCASAARKSTYLQRLQVFWKVGPSTPVAHGLLFLVLGAQVLIAPRAQNQGLAA